MDSLFTHAHHQSDQLTKELYASLPRRLGVQFDCWMWKLNHILQITLPLQQLETMFLITRWEAER